MGRSMLCIIEDAFTQKSLGSFWAVSVFKSKIPKLFVSVPFSLIGAILNPWGQKFKVPKTNVFLVESNLWVILRYSVV